LIKKEHPDWELYWFGHRHSLKNDKNDSLEYREISSLNIPFFDLHTGKVYKVYNPFKVLKIFVGLMQAYNILRVIKPDLILSFGGYLAVPVVMSGNLLGIKSITHEQTLVAGYANKVISKFASKILLSWDSSKIYFPADKVVVTGLPLREDIFSVKSNDFVADNDLPYIFVMGGKSGSHLLNVVIKEALPKLLKKFNVIHQCGDYSVFNDYDNLVKAYSEIKSSLPGKYFVQKFILEDKIGEAYNKANIIVSRSGAHTIAEVLALKKRALFIPIPWVSHNEQYINADYVKSLGLADILLEKELTVENLLIKIDSVLKKTDSQVTDLYGDLSRGAAEKILNEIILAHKEKKA
jgi:UDP-N-acetylglucosamine--N-acetylmuramyl-(pentapeptide) pyrophosphoryl-undecaprenol N-acetylglucosamine transferase